MADFSRLTGKFRIQKDNAIDPASTIKLHLQSLVCTQCRKAKLRCDRQQPCTSCVRRGEAVVCLYQQPRQNYKQLLTAQDRLSHLESLVRDMMRPTDKPSATGTSTNDQSPANLMGLPYSDPAQNMSAANYVGSTHWSAILDDIQELKATLDGEGESSGIDASAPDLVLGPQKETVLFGSSESYLTKHIILHFLPPREEVDRLLAVFFRGESFIIPFIHMFQFQRQYNSFWGNPTETNVLWISVLFSICCLASLIQGATGLPPCSSDEVTARTAQFHIAAGKCLVTGEYHRPQPFAVEALAIYAQCKSMQSLDPSREAGVIFSMAVRLAYELGYHRDPDFVGSFTVFEGEMRRRLWALLKQFDAMISFQLGLPSNICIENCDTKSPRNLSDADFNVDTQVLPISRAETEPMGILWFIVKDRQMNIFSSVCRETLSFHDKSETQIIELDDQIKQMHTTIPKILRTRPISESVSDPPFLIMVRIYVEFIYLKSLCVLHRKYMSQGNTFSTEACFIAGRRLVSQFIEMYKEFAPGGQLCQERWMLTNFTMNDFLMGVMILCLVIHTGRRRDLQLSLMHPSYEKTIFSLLKQAHAICIERSSASRDARYVARAVKAILEDPPAQESTMTPSELAIQWKDSNSLGWLDPFCMEGNETDWGLFDSLMMNQNI
ncbi:hypothetical protein N7478_002604 [Penicillium angulare]|uniref:uncharacterized protein n=1 Tax=Penicillium angulare TaxID=116970 RepID=UPI002540FBFA|nr:uncharacterized protein N7478_002604 [Penicillium angulare]KAJ5286918.1 hypothetical protein N7478_002604 [Penicillium angulare]